MPYSQQKKDSAMEEATAFVKQKRMLEFDPTIHAGHVLTVLTIIFCSIGAWYDMRSSVAMVKEESARQEKELSTLRTQQKENVDRINDSINALALMGRQDTSKMRDDMNNWFMRLNDKLDTKADKR